MASNSRNKIIAGNWKMNFGPKQAMDFFASMRDLNAASMNATGIKLIFPPAYCLGTEIQEAAKEAGFELGAQNVHWEEKGAFTAELSSKELQNIGIHWALIGHSERRQHFGETNESAGKRMECALKTGMHVLFCVGEKLEERESKKTNQILAEQLAPFVRVLKAFDGPAPLIALAYEPVWAIGTGKTATKEQAEETHLFIRSELNRLLGENYNVRIPILYGGSVSPENAKDLMSQKSVDGVLVGGASLKPEQFIQICSA